MPSEIHIKVETGKSIEETAGWLALSVSGVLNELFPDQWKMGMTLVAQRIQPPVYRLFLSSAGSCAGWQLSKLFRLLPAPRIE